MNLCFVAQGFRAPHLRKSKLRARKPWAPRLNLFYEGYNLTNQRLILPLLLIDQHDARVSAAQSPVLNHHQ